MQIIPSIEIYNDKCVHLRAGNFSDRLEYPMSPVDAAKNFAGHGFSFLHVVDLEGAQYGQVKNWATIEALLTVDGLKLEIGGGVRSKEEIERLLEMGARRAVLGSIAVTLPSLVKKWIHDIGSQRIAVAVDVRNGKIVHSGWLEEIEQSPTMFMMELKNAGAQCFEYTDVTRENSNDGPNIELYKELRTFFKDVELIASGGVSTVQHIEALAAAGVSGVILGNVLYDGMLRVDELKPFVG
ncbi:MAG: 1-(5-phosphoribosyl)-5-[(5-phosphoribosylamino)methylideneamino] imidazole-4-carboxamide isomerase [Ignavibacteriales bacterium]|nr:1-(5-phosphoribosyl)-5-[(5-phosphoribosylamino)methylideneamino] imidazole-4-carboxamide isomerase [Ignavibacteriales bacterium]